LVQCAVPLQSNHVHGHEAGPADAVDRNPQSSHAREDADSTLPREDDEHFWGAGVGIIDGSGETLEDPIVLWDNALRNQKSSRSLRPSLCARRRLRSPVVRERMQLQRRTSKSMLKR
jgi:hypothetical protein